jgi:hypothetical protein
LLARVYCSGGTTEITKSDSDNRMRHVAAKILQRNQRAREKNVLVMPAAIEGARASIRYVPEKSDRGRQS